MFRPQTRWRRELTERLHVDRCPGRNGFLYASYHDPTEVEKRHVNLGYEHDHGDEAAAENVKTLVPDVVAVQTDRFYADSTAAK